MDQRFSSPELREAVANAKPILEGVEEAKNRVSSDIRALEAYLESTEAKTRFRLALGMALAVSEAQTDFDIRYALDEIGSASGTIEEEALLWDRDAKGRFRLLYEYSCWEGHVDVDAGTYGGPFFPDQSTLKRETKPLIEAKFDIRKRMWRELPRFVTLLAQELDVYDRHNAQELEEEIPF